MQKNTTRHIFAGGNTSQGFFSYYNYIIDLNNAEKVYILKGGPGTGKSTFMKYIGTEAVKKGYDVEYFHCSSDSNSIDGISIPLLQVAMVDGTSPHAIDPEYPGVVDEIISLGEFWNKDELMQYKNRVFSERKDIKFNFARTYRYLKAAAIISQDTEAINKRYVDSEKINKLTYEIIEELLSNTKNKGTFEKRGNVRCLFASAITPDGVVNYLDSILTTSKIYGLVGDVGMGMEVLLEKFKEQAIARGYKVECYFCGLIPNKLEHLVIPQLDVSFTTINRYHSPKININNHIYFESFMDKAAKEIYADVAIENDKQIDLLIKRAVDSIVKAKKIHFDMEKYYSKSMDFDRFMLFKKSIKDSIFPNKQS